MQGYRCDIEQQKEFLFSILSKNKVLMEIIREAEKLGLDFYYIGAGCICQSVWNYQNHFEPMYGISDVDLVYFDDVDLSYETEELIVDEVRHRFSHLPVAIDVKNQARVHLWYQDYYGYALKPYDSLESAIDSWPTTASAVGVRMERGEFIVYAPYGLNDMFGQIVRPNKTQITEETYRHKCEKWLAKWDSLTIMEW